MSSVLDAIKAKKNEAFSWKNIRPIYDAVQKVKELNIRHIEVSLHDTIKIQTTSSLPTTDMEVLQNALQLLIPWRKGPFELFDIDIQTEWRSYIKYNILRPHFELKDKIVADIGCNNGYYMFKMANDKPKKLVGFDPSALCKLQFEFINHFVKSDIEFELLGVEHLKFYHHKFDIIFMLGVLYHRPDPIGTLKQLKNALLPRGEIIIDTFIIDGDGDMCLTPQSRYAKIPNIYFIPTVKALTNWLGRAGFVHIQVLNISQTTTHEQRATQWTFDQSLANFLDPHDHNRTIEGYPAPKRAYINARV
jgi:tRNA (mo5U34)-methyltransferase